MKAASVLVTGGRGFIGRRLVRSLMEDGQDVRVLTRGLTLGESEVQGDLADPSALAAACAGVATVFHCAGHAHAFKGLKAADDARHLAVNLEGTRRLVDAAAQAGVRRLVFLSSVKAMGEPGDACVDETWALPPDSAYGRAKRAAEDVVLEAGVRYGMHVTNLRLAMVYGAGGRGNLERMAALVRRGWFPPLPDSGNRRSLVHVSDVVSAMKKVAEEAGADGGTYIVAHPEPVSGRALYDALRDALGMPAIGWAVPRSLLEGLARVGDAFETVGRRRLPFDSEVLERLLGAACYLPTKIERELGWRAEIRLTTGLREMLKVS
ncbi:NAD-dependent epimerase/dehydratase family protein [Zoogloea sp.]|uniref:NAD-dependent epimerase/dehydratase family protein n=1 Tax=Zoogloea sp. TaxID=49181 RepID=UPI0035B3D29D